MKKALKYWFSEEKGEVYCLFEASSPRQPKLPYSPRCREGFFSETELPVNLVLGNSAPKAWIGTYEVHNRCR